MAEAELNDQIIFRIGQMCQNVFVLNCLRLIIYAEICYGCYNFSVANTHQHILMFCDYKIFGLCESVF